LAFGHKHTKEGGVVAKDPFTACAEQLAATPRLVRQLLEDHTPTPDGWCRAHDVHGQRHPCSIRRLAELASAHVIAADAARTRGVPPPRPAVAR
jgi:hypothetical protein